MVHLNENKSSVFQVLASVLIRKLVIVSYLRFCVFNSPIVRLLFEMEFWQNQPTLPS